MGDRNEDKFLADVQDFIPIAAAVNICSNILHAVGIQKYKK